jgi:hypothetical protein
MRNLDEILKLSAGTTTPAAPIVHECGDWSDFLTDCQNLPEHKRTRDFRPDWTGTSSWQRSIDAGRNGSDTMAKKAETLIDRMNEQGFLSNGPSLLAPCEIGFMPLVPAVLCGDPMSMLTRVNSQTCNAPVRVYVGIGGGGDVTNDQLVNRGAALTAFVLGLATTRPVELYGLGMVAGYAGGAVVPVLMPWRLETRPADLPTLTWALSCAAVHRAFGFAMADHVAGARKYSDPSRTIIWMRGGSVETMKLQHDLVKLALDLEPQDIVIPRAVLSDDPLLLNPEQWVKDKLAEYAV